MIVPVPRPLAEADAHIPYRSGLFVVVVGGVAMVPALPAIEDEV